MKGEVRIDISARHVHLNRESVDILFGKDYILTEKVKVPSSVANPSTILPF